MNGYVCEDIRVSCGTQTIQQQRAMRRESVSDVFIERETAVVLFCVSLSLEGELQYLMMIVALDYDLISQSNVNTECDVML